MYKSTELSEEEVEQVRQSLTIRGVLTRRLNPKGMTMSELFGEVDKASQEWHDGAFTKCFRVWTGSSDARQ